jgi:hypothetical protein
MNKLFSTTPAIILGLTLTVFSSISLQKSLWPTTLSLSDEDKTHCVQFKNAIGSNRINEFISLSSIFLKQSITEYKKETIATNRTLYKEEVETLLGTPTQKLENKWVYQLSYNLNNDNAVFVFNDDSLAEIQITK